MASHYKRWTEQEDEFLWENYIKLGAKECSKKLKRSYKATCARMYALYGKKERKR